METYNNSNIGKYVPFNDKIENGDHKDQNSPGKAKKNEVLISERQYHNNSPWTNTGRTNSHSSKINIHASDQNLLHHNHSNTVRISHGSQQHSHGSQTPNDNSNLYRHESSHNHQHVIKHSHSDENHLVNRNKRSSNQNNGQIYNRGEPQLKKHNSEQNES